MATQKQICANRGKPTGPNTPEGRAAVVRVDTIGANAPDSISRYEGRWERSFDKALRELQRLRSARYKEMQKQSQFTAAMPAPDPQVHPSQIRSPPQL